MSCISICIYAMFDVHVFIYAYIYIHIYVHIYICIYICTYIYTYVYIHIYIHTQILLITLLSHVFQHFLLQSSVEVFETLSDWETFQEASWTSTINIMALHSWPLSLTDDCRAHPSCHRPATQHRWGIGTFLCLLVNLKFHFTCAALKAPSSLAA